MWNKIAEYQNGNVRVERFGDGTVIRYSKDDEFDFAFPENIDIKITNRCTGTNCAWCHEGSGPDGKHGDILNAPWVDTLFPFQEVAIGGGNPLEHPDLIPFLEKLKAKQVFANLTVNQIHFMQNYDVLKALSEKKLIRGIGVSFNYYDEEFLKILETFPNAVLHVIAGVLSERNLSQLMMHHNLKLLILGYKRIRRGETFFQQDWELHNLAESGINKQINMIEDMLPMIFEAFKVTSFDCLAIEQLHIKNHVPKQTWKQSYQGEDGTMTFYIDAVNNQFAESSTAPLKKRYDIENRTVDEMFRIIKEKHNEVI